MLLRWTRLHDLPVLGQEALFSRRSRMFYIRAKTFPGNRGCTKNCNHETNTRVERQIWTLSAVPIRIQRKISLRYQQDHTPEEPKYVYNKQRFQECLPIHLFIGVDTRQLVNKSFNWSHETHAVVSLLIHLGDMLSQRVTDNQQQQYLQCYT